MTLLCLARKWKKASEGPILLSSQSDCYLIASLLGGGVVFDFLRSLWRRLVMEEVPSRNYYSGRKTSFCFLLAFGFL